MKDLAEKVLLGIINAGYCGEPNELAKQAYDIAAAMQTEVDKRKITAPDEIPKHERLIPFDESHEHDYIYGRVCACGAIKE